MWRAVFLAVGGLLMVTGVESLLLDHAVLAKEWSSSQAVSSETVPVYDDWGFEVGRKPAAGSSPEKRTIHPPEWAPWSMLTSGAVITLYAFASKIQGE